MKKFWLLTLVLVLLLTGCTQVRIRCGVDAEANACLAATVTSQWPDAEETLAAELQAGFQALAAHYRDTLGFQVEETYNDDGCQLELTLLRPCASYTDALRELEEMLTDESLTPFQEVVLLDTLEGETHGYSGNLVLDAQSFLDGLGLEVLPVNLRQYFQESMADCGATLELSLPAGTVVSHSGELTRDGTQATVSTPVRLDGTTELRLSTLAVIRDGVIVPDPTRQPQERLELARQRMILFGVILGVALLALAVTLWILLAKNRRKQTRTEPPANSGSPEDGLSPEESPDRESSPSGS